MGKPQRYDEAGAWHHVVNRGARHQQAFYNAADCRLFLYLLGEARDRFGLQTHAFCIMGNHYHLVVHSTIGDLSAAMQMIGNNYTRRFNARHGYDGALFRGGFRSKRILTDDYLIQASRYVHRNPLDLGPSVGLETYEWSSMRIYAGLVPRPGFLTTSTICGIANGRRPYRQFVIEPQPSDAAPKWSADDQATSAGRLIVPGSGRAEITLPQIDERVATTTGVTIERVRYGARGSANLPRLLALRVAGELTGASADALCIHYHFPSVAAMRAATARAKPKLASAKLQAARAKITASLT